MKTHSESWTESLPPVDPEVEIQLARNSGEHEAAADGVGMSKTDYFCIFEPVARELIAHVQLLPASMFTHHTGPGGLSDHSIEVGLLTLRAFNDSVPAPKDSAPAEEKAKHRAWQAFALAAGVLHDVERIAQSFKIVGYCNKGNIAHEFNATGCRRLYDWIIDNEIATYKVEITRFLDLVCDTDSAANRASSLLVACGFLKNESRLQPLFDEYPERQKAIAELVRQSDMASVLQHRVRNPNLRRTSEENAFSLYSYLCSKPKYWNKLVRTNNPEKRTNMMLEVLAKGLPVVDELFDFYELQYLRDPSSLH